MQMHYVILHQCLHHHFAVVHAMHTRPSVFGDILYLIVTSTIESTRNRKWQSSCTTIPVCEPPAYTNVVSLLLIAPCGARSGRPTGGVSPYGQGFPTAEVYLSFGGGCLGSHSAFIEHLS